ncbi:hypothetical protein JCM19231_2429 [Vibrio ishigakensis]|uniref:Uncharacterized protein n=1 Tax=Vibrio ishigakensis TaxID=1481914 RepID=A0A0B8NZV0_9VIBR|nr:hypothetical protein [Vibrio ishigakensis]GAM59476.1 hypothetical protein JCM19231_2429 [Vibrio ishigakensis]
MDFTVEFILIGITLAMAVLGTFSNPSSGTKLTIIALAVLTSIATGYKTYSNAEENRINKRLIITLVQSSNQPVYFSHDIVKELSSVLENTNQYVSGLTLFEDTGERIFHLENNQTMNASGLIYISKKAMNPVYYAYATEQSIKLELEKIVASPWTDCELHWNQCINELSAISKLALEIGPYEVSETTSSLDSETLTFEIESVQGLKIVLNRNFIEELYGLNPAERGLKILTEGQNYVVENL